MKIHFSDFLSFKKKRQLPLLLKTFQLICFLTLFGFTSSAVFPQNAEIIIKADRTVPIEEVFEILKEQTDHSFIYSVNLFEGMPQISLKKGKTTVGKLMDKHITKLGYSIEYKEDGTILITKKPIVS